MQMLNGSKFLSYALIGLVLTLVLCLVHVLTTFYEQDQDQVKKSVKSGILLAKEKKILDKSVKINKRSITVRMRLEIEKNFNKSSMNKTYTFPRHSS